MNDPNCFNFRKLFPGGFTPQFGANVEDASAVAGLKGASGDLNWDASASWGKSNMDFYMYNTVNASLGPDQPCAGVGRQLSFVVPNQSCTPWFNPGIYDQQEINLNLDLSYALNERVNLAGAEWRNERFEIIREHGIMDRGPARDAGIHARLQRVHRIRTAHRGRLEPEELRRLW